ncbi:hypothetical protein HDZ31DRAFT_61789 [Schizophyllum fasciatum]
MSFNEEDSRMLATYNGTADLRIMDGVDVPEGSSPGETAHEMALAPPSVRAVPSALAPCECEQMDMSGPSPSWDHYTMPGATPAASLPSFAVPTAPIPADATYAWVPDGTALRAPQPTLAAGTQTTGQYLSTQASPLSRQFPCPLCGKVFTRMYTLKVASSAHSPPTR